MDLAKLLTDQLLNILPENLAIYKDSGSWNIYSDDMKEELYHQELNENLKQFLLRVIYDLQKKEYNESLEYDVCMSISDRSYCL